MWSLICITGTSVTTLTSTIILVKLKSQFSHIFSDSVYQVDTLLYQVWSLQALHCYNCVSIITVLNIYSRNCLIRREWISLKENNSFERSLWADVSPKMLGGNWHGESKIVRLFILSVFEALPSTFSPAWVCRRYLVVSCWSKWGYSVFGSQLLTSILAFLSELFMWLIFRWVNELRSVSSCFFQSKDWKTKWNEVKKK